MRNDILRLVSLYPLDITSKHGIRHWGRVYEIATLLCERTPGADLRVCQLFSIIHDCARMSEHCDMGHGRRAHIRELVNRSWGLSEHQHDLLSTAVCEHTTAGPTHNPTIGVCYDSDRLDLLRVGITPCNDYLSTAAARDPEIQKWANNRATNEVCPDIVTNEWRIKA